MSKYSDGFLRFVKETPNAYYAADNIAEMLREKGFLELSEKDAWDMKSGKYFVRRNDATIIALDLPREYDRFSIAAAHGDSPCFRIKPNPEMAENGYLKLNTEIYGGMLQYSWLDRPLSVAGRVIVKENGVFKSRLINIQRDLLVIPSLAIHMNRGVNDGAKFNPQKELLPLVALGSEKGGFKELLDREAGAEVLDYDLYLYNRDEPKYAGNNAEFILSPRIDNLGCAYTVLNGFLLAENKKSAAVYVCFNNEETGNRTREAAGGTFLEDVLERVCLAAGKDLRQLLAASFFVSADNGHALHPNYPEKADPTSRACINGGILIKHHENYTTDGLSSAILKDIYKDAAVPYQEFASRSDMGNGGTLGKASLSHVSLCSADIGMAQLAMHSANELSGALDIDYMIAGMKAFYEADIRF